MNKEFFKTEQEIINWLETYHIKNYILIQDKEYGFIVDVNANVNLSFKNLKFIPIKFNIISGNFYCHSNQLKSLKFCPHTVAGDFYCHANQLISLEGCSQTVGSNFYCNNNQLITLNGSPQTVGNDFYCYANQLTTLEGCPKTIGGDFDFSNNQLTSLEFCPKIINGSFYCFNNQIKNYINFPEKIFKTIILNDGKQYEFEEAYKIHLKDKAQYEKQLLNGNIKSNNVDKNNNSFKI